MRWKLGGTELAGFRIELHIAGQHVSDSGFGWAMKSALIKTLINIALDLRCGFLLCDQFSDAQHHRKNGAAAFGIPAGWINAQVPVLRTVAIDQTMKAVGPAACFYITGLAKGVNGG